MNQSLENVFIFIFFLRRHNLTSVCLESLTYIYNIPTVPIMDCYQKIRQQVKCYVQTAATLGKNELQTGLDVIESTNLKYFSKGKPAKHHVLVRLW